MKSINTHSEIVVHAVLWGWFREGYISISTLYWAVFSRVKTQGNRDCTSSTCRRTRGIHCRFPVSKHFGTVPTEYNHSWRGPPLFPMVELVVRAEQPGMPVVSCWGLRWNMTNGRFSGLHCVCDNGLPKARLQF